MYLSRLILHNFKNITAADLEFKAQIIYLMGKNASGKTSLLDAIHYLSSTRSAINLSDTQNIQFQQSQFILKGIFQRDGSPREIVCTYQKGKKKTIAEDGLECTRFSEHIGRYPVVLIAPQDMDLVRDGADVRRKFFDTLLSQLNKKYLTHLINYTQQLKQRNSVLHRFSETGKIDYDLLESYDQSMIPSASYIAQQRELFMQGFVPVLQDQYSYLAQNSFEKVDIKYSSDLQKRDFSALLHENKAKDLLLKHTSAGIHRDNFEFLINQNELKKTGSQGQQKSFLIALKLTEFQNIEQATKHKPILLLDDIFDKLDDFRIHKLMQLVSQGAFGQLFITDARQEHSTQVVNNIKESTQFFKVEKGSFVYD